VLAADGVSEAVLGEREGRCLLEDDGLAPGCELRGRGVCAEGLARGALAAFLIGVQSQLVDGRVEGFLGSGEEGRVLGGGFLRH
jgi:hypothetical protein